MVKIVGQDNKVSIVSYEGKWLIDPAIVYEIKNGIDGKDGERGPEGLAGKDGRDGIDGKDGRDGKDGKDGISFWIEYDKKKSELVFKNDGGKKNPAPIKLPETNGWGFGAGAGRGGVTAQADWNQTNKNAVDYIKNKPEIHNVELKRVNSLPLTGEPYILYLVPSNDPETSNIYDEYIWAIQSGGTYDWEKLGSTAVNVPVQDVQKNDGTSIVSSGIATLPPLTVVTIRRFT